ncbi:DUF3618 domain-containing protein [Pseudomonas sp. NFR16]|uniref:DUF3618 domain-containing protein n=1 Tax=Pseudomonas sp. NFR16 TaxID=1566248 RepID=UPI0008C50A99|nr:DUF3618 domain-containing protein [Pseudomonas sp. NFR16]SEJ79264.1 Protein of unknown function [Pseudomonas sp. NFR16]
MSTESSFATKEQFEQDAVPDVEVPRSPDTLERDIDARRANIENIVDALENKLSPGQLFDQALAFTRNNGGEFFTNLGTSIKNNPVPVVLATVGVGWLMLGQNNRPHSSGPSVLGQVGETLGGAAAAVSDSLSGAKDYVRQSAHQLGEKASHLAEGASDKMDDLKGRATSGTSNARDTLKSTADRTQDALLSQGRNLQGTLDYMLKEQPLALAAIGIALGATIGVALPKTSHEDKLFGQTRDKLTDKVKTTMDQAWESVSDLGKDVVDDLRQAKPSAPVTGSNLDV